VSLAERSAWILAGVLLASVANGEPVALIRDNGASSNRIDIVVLGDGYSATDVASGKYAADAGAAVAGMFLQEPYAEYQRYFNVHRVDVTSAASGVDHPSAGVFKNTALDAAYDCADIPRLICVDTSKVNAVLVRSLPAPDSRDIVLVLVNDAEYGGSGGSVAVASTHPSSVELVLHEVGHSFGLLADEYDYSPPACNNAAEPPEANVTRQTSRSAIKWGAWVDAATPVPTLSTTEAPGLYQGAKYCPTGLYRPTYDSKMRTLGRPFGAVNSEAHVKRIYNFVTPLDSSFPRSSVITITQGSRQSMSVTFPQPLTHMLTTNWSVDGVVSGHDASFQLDSSTLAVGNHSLSVTIRDETSIVRSDPTQLLRASRSWTVTVTAASFSNHPLLSGDPIRVVHVTELRARINALRTRCDLGAAQFTDPSLVAGVTSVRGVHIAELRTALREAYLGCGVFPPNFADQALNGAMIRAPHIMDLRSAVRALE